MKDETVLRTFNSVEVSKQIISPAMISLAKQLEESCKKDNISKTGLLIHAIRVLLSNSTLSVIELNGVLETVKQNMVKKYDVVVSRDADFLTRELLIRERTKEELK